MTKLTLSVPEEAVAKAKQYAKQRGISVSALFTETIRQLSDDDSRIDAIYKKHPSWEQFSQLADQIEAHDERSAHILRKHG